MALQGYAPNTFFASRYCLQRVRSREIFSLSKTQVPPNRLTCSRYEPLESLQMLDGLPGVQSHLLST